MQDFKKLTVWKKSYDLAMKVYDAAHTFPKVERYELASQMRRCSISVPANIAEGCGRYTSPELVRFLDIAMGSLSELECYIMFARDLHYLSEDGYSILEQYLVEVRRMLIAFIQRVRGR